MSRVGGERRTGAVGLSSAQGFTDGDRHGWIDRLCSRLARVVIGREADRLAQAPVLEPVGVVLLPVWWWGPSQIDMGAKDRARTGGRLHMPVRYLWSVPPLLLVPAGSTTTLSWSVRGLGNHDEGTVCVTVTGTEVSSAMAVADSGEHVCGVLSPEGVRRQLAALAEDGRSAWWELLSDLEGRVRTVVNRVHVYLSKDVAPDQSHVRYLLDPTAIDSIVDVMMFGGEAGGATVTDIMERALAPGALARVDPLKFILDAVRVAAIDAIRRRTGDPGVGSKVRSIAREIGSWDPVRVHSTYRQRWPGDHLGIDRTRRALSVAPDPMAAPVDLDTLASLPTELFDRSA